MNINKYQFKDGLIILASGDIKALYNEIWEDEIYTKEYDIKQGDIVIDIGANVGVFSLYAGKKGAKVYCFEPNPQVFELLKENIRVNNLEDSVIPINAAISDTDSYVELYIPNSEKIYKEGSASISKQYVDGISGILKDDFTVCKVKSKTLEGIFKEFAFDKVNFMKIDCEGSELPLFKNSKPDIFHKIENIAMETHCFFYSQKELYDIVRANQYYVNNYIKPSGHFMNGYLYASNKKSTSSSFIVPVIDLPDYVKVGEPVEIDLSGSFYSSAFENVQYKMKIRDGIYTIDNIANTYKTVFEQPGQYVIGVEIGNDSMCDTDSKQVWVLKEDYFKEQVDYILKKPGEKIHLYMKGARNLCLKSSDFPSTWDLKYIVFGISQEEYGEKNTIAFEFNGQKTIIKELYKEIKIESVPGSMDIHFSLATEEEANFTVTWWAEAETNAGSAQPEAIDEGNALAYLPELGKSALFLFEGEKNAVIAKENFPKSWAVKSVVIGIAAMEHDGVKPFLDGCYNDKERSVDLTGTYYKEIRLSDVSLDENLEFIVRNDVKKLIKVAWWAE